MKTITLYRSDFKKSAEANFFDDLLQQLNVNPSEWDDINEVELNIEFFTTNP